MSINTSLARRLVVGFLMLLIALTAAAFPLVDGLQQLPPALGDDAPQPAPLVLFAFALLALGTFLRRYGGGSRQFWR